jgi:hypothetical protein
MINATVVVNESYAGGGTAFTASFTPQGSNTQISLTGFDTDDATIKVTPIGTSAQTTISLTTAETSFKVLDALIQAIEVSGLSAGSYRIQVIQW